MFKCYRQLEHSDCGITCLRMVARHYGRKIPATFLKETCDISRLGMSIKDLADCSEKIGLNSAVVRVGEEQIENMPLPAILYWRQNHFIVLYKISDSGKIFKIADPAIGKVVCKKDEFFKSWIPSGSNKGIAVLTEPGDSFFDKEYVHDNRILKFVKYINSYAVKYKASFAFALLLTLLIMLGDFAIPLLLRQTIDEGIKLKDSGLVVSLLSCQLAVMVGALVVGQGMNLLLMRVGLKIDYEMMKDFISKISHLPISYFDRQVSSTLIQKIGDQSKIKEFLMSFSNVLVASLISLFVFSCLLIHYSRLIFCIFIIFSFIEVLWNILFLNRKKSLNYLLFQKSSENYNHANELTTGMADLKVNNAETQRINRWGATQKEINKITFKGGLLGMVQTGGHSIISRLKELSVTGISAFLVMNGDMTFGIMITLGYITGRLAKPFSSLTEAIDSLQQSLLSYLRVTNVIDDKPMSGNKHKFSLPTIEFKKVSFKYPGGSSPYVINDLTLTISKGSTIALVGESGCGKSTLIKLMLGFYIPQNGEIRLSDHNVINIDTDDWLKHCGVVMQEGKIFSGSILENIALSAEKPDRTKCENLLDTVGLLDFVSRLPGGVNTLVGSAGIELSGGQKQRLLIARALYKDPDILFLDEATSSLDAKNERSIVEHIRELDRNKTIIIAAHRLSTVQNADKILYINAGSIVESGTHDELCLIKGRYWELVKNQLQLSI